MSKVCCPKPVGKIIKDGKLEAGLVGLDEMFQMVLASGLDDDRGLATELIALARQFGNYITPSAEELYKEALLREYKLYCKKAKKPEHS